MTPTQAPPISMPSLPPETTPVPSKPKKSFHIPSLDGLRAVSFLIVFLGHAATKKWIPGYFGLAVFFFLSGYLITTLLRMEFDKTGGIHFKEFYLRRALRILPPFYLVLGLASLLTLTHVLHNTLWPGAVLAQAFHFSNYYIVREGWWWGRAPGTWIFWSLAVEEHFYLVFPFLYLLLRRRGLSGRQQMLALAGLCAAILLWRCLLIFGLHAPKDRVYVASDTRVDSILFGCILAVYGNPVLDTLAVSERRIKTLWLPLSVVVLLVSFALHGHWYDQTIRYTIQGAALIPIFVAAIRYPDWGLFRALNWGWMRFLGLLSYSLYLLHPTVLYGLYQWTHWPVPVQGVVGLAVSLALAALIYRYVEKPCAGLRRRLSQAGGSRAVPPSPAPDAAALPPLGRSHRVARNILGTVATQLLSWALAFVVTLFLPRYLGDAGMGKWAFAAAFTALFGTFVPLGTSTVLIREIARDRSRTGELLLAAIGLRVPLGLLMTGLTIGLVSLLHIWDPAHYSVLTRTLVIIGALGMVLFSLNDALASALQGQENLTRQNIAALTEKFLSSGLLVALIFLKAPIWMMASVVLFTTGVSLLVNLAAFRPLWGTLRWPTGATMRYLVAAGMPFFAMVVFRMIYNQVDVPILTFFTNDRTVGWYAVAARLLGSTLFIPVALATALLPSLTRLHAESETQFLLALRRAMALVILCAVPIAIPLIALPQKILLGFLHYPATFAHSAPILALYGFGTILWYLSQITGTGLIVLDRQRDMCRISLMAMALTVGGCLILIPFANHVWHNGGIGAAMVDIGVEIYMNLAFLAALPRGTFDSRSGQVFSKAIVAALPMVALMIVLRGGYQWAGAGLGIVIYAVLCYGFGCLTSQDLQTLKQALSRRPAASS